MQLFTFAVLIPATVALVAIALLDRARGDGELWRAALIGSIGGLTAACAYDVFRLPFVYAAAQQVGPDWLRLPLFKVFPRFGAMILGESFSADQSDSRFSIAAHVIGWIYHFSNGMTFGIMYMALIGNASRRSPLWAILFATGIELLMLATPYTSFFSISMSARFVVVTMAAHMIFGIVLGYCVKRMAVRRAQLAPAA